MTDSSGTRRIARLVAGQPTSDGAGVRLYRVIGGAELPELDPFLLLDEFLSDDPNDYIAGFPNHPHRGFETVTYMLAGRMRHEDNQGNRGVLEAGSVQWMTAGRGIFHSEMPEQEDGLMWGFQLWVNLPAKDKMTAPRYQDIPPTDVPEVESGDGVVRVLAGSYGGVNGPISDVEAEPVYFDVHLQAGARFETPLPGGHNAFVYCYAGAVDVDGTTVARRQLATLTSGDRFEAQAGKETTRFLLVAGKPFGEPVARYGPFVMNTREELMEAVADLQAGRF